MAKKGASSGVLQLLGSFLLDRQMSVKVDNSRSGLRRVNAGAPQGSVLGCFLFNMGIDDLEEGFIPDGSRLTQEDSHQETHGRTDDFPAMSTPIRVRQPEILTESPVPDRARPGFMILPRVANVPHWIPRPKDPTF